MMESPSTRNLDEEHRDNERRYAYDFDQVLRRYMLRAFTPFLPPGRALELGCYRGDFTELLSGVYRDLTVVDGARELLSAMQARLGERARGVLSRFESYVPEAPFDAIFLVHTLEHLDDRVGLLERIGSWLTPQGRLFLVVPNAEAPSRQIAVHMGLIAHNAAVTPAEHDHGHRVTYTFDTLAHDVRAAGLTIHHRAGVLFKPLANFQFDKAMAAGIVGEAYLDGCYQLGLMYPQLCASIFLLCGPAAAEGERR